MTFIGRKTTRAALALVLALVALVPLLAGSDAHAAKPKSGLYWGAWIGPQLTGTEAPWDMSAVSDLENKLHKGMSLVQFSAPFFQCGNSCSAQEFPSYGMTSIRNHGSIPILAWGSQASNSEPNDSNYSLAKIASGAYDGYIAQFAQEAKNWGHPFFLRFDWEMNGTWFPWSARMNGNSAASFVAAWRHVHEIFTDVGATNATWVWCPYASGNKRIGSLKSLYPGNKYVDWTCLDAYNWGRHSANPAPWRTFSYLIGPSYRKIVNQVAPKKPMMIGELGSSGGGKPKAEWIDKMFAELPKRYPKVRALVWFDSIDRGTNWTLESAPPAVKAFSTGLHRGPYRGDVYGSLEDADPIAPPG